MKPRACVVVSSEMTVRAFLQPQLRAMREHYDVTVVVNTADGRLLERLGIEAALQPIAIGRTISLSADLQSLAALVRFMRRERFDLVHSMTPKAGLLAMVSAKLTGVPVRIHTFTGQVWATRRGFARAMLKALDAVIARCATFTLADSATQREMLVREGVVSAGRMAVLGHGSVSGVDADRFRPDPPRRQHVRARLGLAERDVVLLYAGRLTRDKGVLDLARAFAVLAVERPELRLLMVGPDEQDLRPAIRDICRGCDPRVHFLDFTDAPEEVIAAADLLSLPSYREGFGSVVIEAAACGLPAVASRIYGLVDAVVDGQTGLLHEPGDVEDLTARLRDLAADTDRRGQLGEAARARAIRDFSPSTLVAELLGLYVREREMAAAIGDGWYRRFGKRAFDVVVAGAAIAVLAPVGALLALAIRIMLGAPVFFRQERPGRGGALFEIVKFRTMIDRRDGAGRLLPDAERLTPFGRFLRSTSLDELPELWNVLKGDMSLVGPRPLLTVYLERYTPAQARRHLVRPGITGLAQVSGRNAMSWERKFALDLEYVERCSPALDARILVLTLWHVMTRQGVNQPGQATVEEFLG